MPEAEKKRIRTMVAVVCPDCRVDFDPLTSTTKIRFRIDNEVGKPIAWSDWNHPNTIAAWSDEELRERILSYLARGIPKRSSAFN